MDLKTPPAAALPLPAISAGRSLLKAMVQSDRSEAIKLAMSLQDGPHWPFAATEAARQLRKEWQDGRIDIGAASRAYGALRSMLVYERADPVPASGLNVLLYVPEREVHSIGAEILADRLRCAGAQVELLVQVPEAQAIERLSTGGFDRLGVSLGSDPSLLGMADFIACAKAKSGARDLQVVVGGQAVTDAPSEYDFLGADTVCRFDQDPLIGFGGLGTAAPVWSKRLV